MYYSRHSCDFCLSHKHFRLAARMEIKDLVWLWPTPWCCRLLIKQLHMVTWKRSVCVCVCVRVCVTDRLLIKPCLRATAARQSPPTSHWQKEKKARIKWEWELNSSRRSSQTHKCMYIHEYKKKDCIQCKMIPQIKKIRPHTYFSLHYILSSTTLWIKHLMLFSQW